MIIDQKIDILYGLTIAPEYKIEFKIPQRTWKDKLKDFVQTCKEFLLDFMIVLVRLLAFGLYIGCIAYLAGYMFFRAAL